MKVCPQCNSSFEDDFVYCLNDGNILRNESGEQETVIGNRVRVQMTPSDQGPVTACPSCGLANRVNSRFCKKCGGPLAGHAPAPEPTIAFQPSVFTLPAAASMSTPRSGNNTTLMVVLALVAIFVIGGAIIYTKRGDTAVNNAASNVNRAANSNKAVANAMNAAANALSNAANYNPSDSRIGKTGTFTTDSNLREYPSPDSFRLGTHYRGARVRILEVADVRNDEGGTSSWFRIEVISYGTSLDPKNYGLDKDPGTPDAGWVNSHPKVWDAQTNGYSRKQLVSFD